jgi:hypothetical protein
MSAASPAAATLLRQGPKNLKAYYCYIKTVCLVDVRSLLPEIIVICSSAKPVACQKASSVAQPLVLLQTPLDTKPTANGGAVVLLESCCTD